MAWQLIYTSAPRLLEAGRSGFGTVARHRQISPLLVSAIERASQFARQPGLDPDRVVFAHRIVAVGGGRFHVLSCIRDAGADYTGRTNHIAHHLIAEPREIAALGSSGPSPADILCEMAWVTSWTDAPRHLDTADEIPLAHFAAQTSADGSAWARLTGEPSHAWLLANGEASRGAYLVVPAGTDLRPLFAESLRLKPERAWQNGFITSLQPSDEPSDFRWIGLESTSPLRAQAESSGRPTLDLTAPRALPHAEVSAAASAQGASLPFAPEGSAAREPSAPVRRQEVDPFQTYKPTSRMPWKWIVAGTGAALLVAGIAGTMWLRAAGQQEVFESEIDRVLGSESTGYFSDATKSDLKTVPAELRPVALDLAKGGRDLARARKAASSSAKAEAITAVETASAGLQSAGRNVPAQISDLVRQMKEAEIATPKVAKATPPPRETPKPAETPRPEHPAAKPPPETVAETAPKTPAAATAPIYFVNGLAALKESRFPEVGKGVTYFLRATISSEPARLIDPTAQGKLHRTMTEGPVFIVDETAKQIAPTPAGSALHPPFVLLAREAGGRDVAQWWVVAESPVPLLPKRATGLTRTGNLLSLDTAKLGLPGVPKNPLKMLVPEAFAVPGKRNESLVLNDGKADLAPHRAEVEKLREVAKTRIKELEEALSAKPDRDPTPDFREKKKVIADTVKRDIANWAAKEDEKIEKTMKKLEEAKRKEQHKAIAKQKQDKEDAAGKEIKDGKGPLFQELGGCIVALCTDADFRERDPLYTLGTELRALSEKAEAKDQAGLLARTRHKVQDALGGLSSMPESKIRYEATLKELAAMIRLISPENEESRAERARLQALWKTQLLAKQEELRVIAAHPLLAEHSPPIAVRLMVVSDGAEIPLMEIEFSW